jgi:hypothetical protein
VGTRRSWPTMGPTGLEAAQAKSVGAQVGESALSAFDSSHHGSSEDIRGFEVTSNRLIRSQVPPGLALGECVNAAARIRIAVAATWS